MQALEPGQVTSPVLASEVVPMPSLGGTVTVRGCTLDVLMQQQAFFSKASEPREGETDAQAAVRAGTEIIARALQDHVVYPNGQRMWTMQEWLTHGSQHADELFALHDAVKRVNGGAATGAPAESTTKN